MSKALVQSNTLQDQNALIQLVSFHLAQEEYGVEVLKVREIIRMIGITHMPNTPHYVEGIINLRGKVIPIISMRKRFGLGETDNSSQTRIIVMDIDGELTGFIVDGVSEVIRIHGGEIQPPPVMANGNAAQDCINGVIKQGERLLISLDLNRLFSDEEKAALGSSG